MLNHQLRLTSSHKAKERESIISKLKVFEAFAGVGSQRMALRNIGIPFEVVGICEWDKNAIKAYQAIHSDKVSNLGYAENLSEEQIDSSLLKVGISGDGKSPSTLKQIQKWNLKEKQGLVNSILEHKNFVSIMNVNPSKIPDHDLFTYSFPCFVAGTKVLTDNGYKNIEDMKTGDMVLTHKNRFRPVVIPMKQMANHIYKLNTMGSNHIYATEEHPFYVRKKSRIWEEGKNVRKFDMPEWVEMKDLTKEYYVGVSVNQKSKLPKWEGISCSGPWGHKTTKNDLNSFKAFENYNFWWLVGRYLGDGWTVDSRKDNGTGDERVVICCDKSEFTEIESRLEQLEWLNYSIAEEGSIFKYHITNKELKRYLDQFDKGAHNKKLTNDIFDLPVNYLKSFVSGYLSADGSFNQKYYRATSVSEDLINGLSRVINKAYKAPTSVYKTIRPETHEIDGRIVNQRDSYSLSFKKKVKPQDNAFYEDGYIWYPINSIERDDEYFDYVYNIEVEEDNSYTANNIIVHNCQDISVAGKQEGLTKGSGTRSGLLWECEKIIKEKKPRFLLMENVKNLVSKRHKPDFDIWCEWLVEQGYTNYWEIINAKDQGVPQNRERIFMVSILGEHRPFSFPESKILDIRLKDILQDKVDEKFYISEEKTKQLLVNNNGDIDLSKQVVGTCHERNDLAFATRDRVYNPNKVSPTLTATMYKDAPKIIQVGNIVESDGGWSNPQRGRIYSSEGLSPSLNTVGGGGQEPKIVVENTPPDLIKVGRIGKEGNVHDGNLVYSSEGISPTLLARDYKGPVKIVDRPKVLIKNATKQGYLEAGEGDSIDISYPNSKTKRGRVQEGISHTLQTMDLVGTIEFGEVFVKGKAVEPPLIGASRGRYNEDNEIEQQLELNGDGVSNTLTTVQKDNYVVERSFRIRKLTPLECWRLMSFTDEDFYKAESVSSNSQLYKQAGNSIVTKILEGIFAAIYSIILD